MPAKGPDDYYDSNLSVDELADIKAEIDEEKREELVIEREIRSIEEIF